MKIFTAKIFHIAIMAVLISSLIVQAQEYNFSKKFGSTGTDRLNAVFIDSNGNTYLAGEFSGTVNFSPSVSLTSAGNVDFYLLKLDVEGNVLWGYKAGGTLTDRGYGVVLDPNGDVIVTGHYFGQCTFGTTTLSSAGNLDVFTAKFDTAGNMLWIRDGKSVSQASTRGIASDAQGNFIITGYYGTTNVDSVRFDNVKVVTNGNRDVFTVKYNNNGEALWGKTAGGPKSGEQGNAVAVDPDGNIYVTGIYTDTASIDNVTLYGTGTEIFLAKYSPDGNLLWAKSAGGPKTDNAYGIAVDPQGYVYISGGIDSVATFETTTIFTEGGFDAFLAKYDFAGNLIWVKSGGGTANDVLNDIALDKYGNILGTGYFHGPATFGVTVLDGYRIPIAEEDVFFIKYDPAGNILGIKEAAGSGDDRGTIAAVDSDGNLIAGGYLKSWLKIGADSLVSAGGDDIFLTKIFESTLPVELVSFNAAFEKGAIKLTWLTATETNNAGFQVERKSNNSWESIGFIEGKGSSSEKNTYSFIDKDISSEKYFYRLKQVDYDGTFAYSKEVEIEVEIPSKFELGQNFPNPFNPVTTIKLTLPAEAFVTLSIFNSLGEESEVLLNNSMDAGKHALNFDAKNYSSGVYVYVIKAVDISGNSFISSKKMIVLK